MSAQKVSTKTHFKYVGVILDVTSDLLKAIYYSVFDSYIRYACQVWGQSKNRLLIQIGKCQNKALRLLSFKHFIKSSNPIYKKMQILKLEDVVLQNNCHFVYDQLQESLSTTFDNYFRKTTDHHSRNTGGEKLNVHITKTSTCGLQSSHQLPNQIVQPKSSKQIKF